MSRQARSVVVGNAGLLPGGFTLLPGARLDDGLLDVGILAPSSPLGWARVGYRIMAGTGHEDFRPGMRGARVLLALGIVQISGHDAGTETQAARQADVIVRILEPARRAISDKTARDEQDHCYEDNSVVADRDFAEIHG